MYNRLTIREFNKLPDDEVIDDVCDARCKFKNLYEAEMSNDEVSNDE